MSAASLVTHLDLDHTGRMDFPQSTGSIFLTPEYGSNFTTFKDPLSFYALMGNFDPVGCATRCREGGGGFECVQQMWDFL